MKDQNEAIRRQLIKAVKEEMHRRLDKGETQRDIAGDAGTNPPFVSNFLNDNEAGMHGLSLAKLISMANGLGLKLDLKIS